MSIINMKKNAHGVYEADDGQESESHFDQTREKANEDHTSHRASSAENHQQQAQSLDSIYEDLNQRNDDYIKQMRSSFEATRQSMLDQMKNMTGRYTL